jgi:hypothetical protein
MTNDKRDSRRSSMFEDDHDHMKLVFNAEHYYEGYDPEDIPDLMKDKKEIVFPAQYIVCYVCEGRGSYVDPNIDRNGLDPSEMDEDFAESYWDGAFDITCRYCEGQRVVLEIDTHNPSIDSQLWALVSEIQMEQSKYEDEVDAEQRVMGYL